MQEKFSKLCFNYSALAPKEYFLNPSSENSQVNIIHLYIFPFSFFIEVQLVDIQYYMFQLYYMMVQHLYTLQIYHHSNSSNHLSSYKVVTILFIFYAVHYIPMTYVITWDLYLDLNPLHLFYPTSLYLCNYESVFVLLCLFFCFLDFACTVKSWSLCLFCLISPSIIPIP